MPPAITAAPVERFTRQRESVDLSLPSIELGAVSSQEGAFLAKLLRSVERERPSHTGGSRQQRGHRPSQPRNRSTRWCRRDDQRRIAVCSGRRKGHGGSRLSNLLKRHWHGRMVTAAEIDHPRFDRVAGTTNGDLTPASADDDRCGDGRAPHRHVVNRDLGPIDVDDDLQGRHTHPQLLDILLDLRLARFGKLIAAIAQVLGECRQRCRIVLKLELDWPRL